MATGQLASDKVGDPDTPAGLLADLKTHPRGLVVLSATELAERFSYDGMVGLLVLYMVHQLLQPEHAAKVLGLSALRTLFEFRGPMSNQAFASLIYGWYSGLVYFTPLIGGWIADRWLGARRTVMIAVLIMLPALPFLRRELIAAKPLNEPSTIGPAASEPFAD